MAATSSDGFGHAAYFEPAVLTGPLALPGPVPVGFTADDNLVYAPHLYNESISPIPVGSSIEDGFANAATAAANYGTTFFSGEWGWFGDPAIDEPKIARYAAQEDLYRVGGTWWQWRQACGDPHAVHTRGERPGCGDAGVELSDGLLTRAEGNVAILSRAYPRAAPGVLDSIVADVASGALEISGRADRAGVSADLWVPARCGAPEVSGSNVGTAEARAVPGGWRIEVVVPTIGEYATRVTCRS